MPLIALIAAMHTGLAFGWWPLLVLGIPAAALTVRTFIIQHDCGHGSFFRSRRINDWLGRACSLLTLTPYSHWRRHHAQHHGGWNDLDRRDASGLDIYSSCMTVDEYNALGSWKRRFHRIARHQAISLLALPPQTRLFMCHDYKAPGRDTFRWESTVADQRRNVHLANGATEESFAAMRMARDATLPTPALLLPSIQVNIRGGRFPQQDSAGVTYLRIPVRRKGGMA